MLPNSMDMIYFKEVARLGNISRASETLNISQPSLSLAIKRLEKAMGHELIDRGKRGVRLTVAGEKLLGHIQLLEAEWEKVKTEAGSTISQVKGRFRLGCHPAVAHYALPTALADLLRQYPELEIDVINNLSRHVVENVIAHKIDLALAINPVPHPDLIITELGTDQFSCFHLKSLTDEVAKKEFNPCFIFDPSLAQSQYLLTKLKLAKRKVQMVTAQDLDFVAQLVFEGAGIGLVPERVMQQASLHPTKNKKNWVKLKEAPNFVDRICLCYRVEHRHTKAVREMVSVIKHHFQINKI